MTESITDYWPTEGDIVEWVVDEACAFTCKNCGKSLHTHTTATKLQGMVVSQATIVDSITCDHSSGKDSYTGCKARNNFLDHIWGVAFEGENTKHGGMGGFFSTTELRLIRGHNVSHVHN